MGDLRVAHFHVLFEEAGGGEVLALQLYRALREHDVEVDLYTTYVDPSAWNVLASNLGGKVPQPRVISVKMAEWLRAAAGGRAVRLRRIVAVRTINKALAEGLLKDYDLVIETQTNFPMNVDVSYIHFPAVYGFVEERGKGLAWKAYNWLVRHQISRALGSPLAVWTNSNWSRAYVLKAYGLKAKVIHPPVRYEELSPLFDPSKKAASKLVLTVSRISPEKNLEELPRIASQVPEAQFYLVGSTSKYSGPVIQKIEEAVDKFRAKNFEVLTNLPWEKLKELYAEAKVYLHPPFPEHFGIAVAEAASVGALPVVYKDGGAWTDVVEPVEPALGYASVEEAPPVVRWALRNWSRDLAGRFNTFASQFSYTWFSEQVYDSALDVLSLKRKALQAA